MRLRQRIELALESALSQAEDPQERIRALVRDLKARQVGARRALGLTIALEKKLLDEFVAAEDSAIADERASREAVSRGDDGAAAEAAARLIASGKARNDAHGRWDEQRVLVEKVRAAVGEASRRTEDVAHAHTLLLARAHCADATKAIADTLSLLDSPELKVALGRASLRVEQAEAQR